MYGKQENDGEQLGNSRKSQEEEIYKEAEFLRSYVGYEILDDVADNFNGNTERGNEIRGLLNNAQANILKSHKKKHALYAFLSFKEGKKNDANNWLKNRPITSALTQFNDKYLDQIHCLYFTYEGYTFLGQKQKAPNDGSNAFEEGLFNRVPFETKFIEARYKKNFKKRRSRNVEHINPGKIENVHCLYFIATDNIDDIRKCQQDISGAIKDFAHVFFEIGSRTVPSDVNDENQDIVDWFGFRDGISNPRFFPGDNYKEKLGTNYEEPSVLKVVLRPDFRAGGSTSHSCGSFVVFMKLEQNIENFNNAVEQLVRRAGEGARRDLILAQLIGRFQDGTPLVLSDKPNDKISKINFDYSDDKKGFKCPLHAHIRKANPMGKNNKQKRIVRRGMFYGVDTKGKKGKGMLFMSFQSDLELQFEDIVNRQMYRSNPQVYGNDAFEPLILLKNKVNPPKRNYSIGWGEPTSYFGSYNEKTRLVTIRGGFYFFAPSIKFIKECLD